MTIITFEDSYIKAWPNEDAPVLGTAVDLDGFFAPQETDAMCVGYHIPNEETPRLSKAAPPALIDNDVDMPLLQWVLVDFDNPAHQRWTSDAEAQRAFLDAQDKLPDELYTGGYTTRAGYRFMWRLEHPLWVTIADSFLSALHDKLASLGLPVDEGTAQWTRLMRLPRAKRDGVVLDPYIDRDITSLDPHSLMQTWGKDYVVEQPTTNYQAGDAPDAPRETTLAERALLAPWPVLLSGDAIPPNDEGSVRNSVRSYIAAVAGRHHITEPDLVYALLYPSVAATERPELLDQLWELSHWACAREAARADEPEPEPPVVAAVLTPDDWSEVCRVLEESDDVPGNYYTAAVTAAEGGTPKKGIRLTRLLKALVKGGIKDRPKLEAVGRAITRPTNPDTVWTAVLLATKNADEEVESIEVTDDEAKLMAYTRTVRPLVLSGQNVLALTYRSGRLCYTHTHPDRLRPALRKLPFDVEPVTKMANGKHRHRQELFDLFAASYSTIRYSSLVEDGDVQFDYDTDTVIQGCHFLRNVPPVYDDTVAEWLRRMGGDHHDHLRDWLALLTTPEKALPALYIKSAPGTGKSLMLMGLARLFEGGAIGLGEVLVDRFRTGMLLSPLATADEGLATDHNIAIAFRDLITTARHRVEPKGQALVDLEARFRTIICANNQGALPLPDKLSPDDRAAIIDRVLYIEPLSGDMSPARMFDNGPQLGWAPEGEDDGKVARHVAWLIQNHEQVTAPGRLAIATYDTPWHKRLSQGGALGDRMIQSLARMLKETKACTNYGVMLGSELTQDNFRLVPKRNSSKNELFVDLTSVKECWKGMHDHRLPDDIRFREVLNSMGTSRQLRRHTDKHSRMRGWSIPLDKFTDYLLDHGGIDVATQLGIDIPEGEE